ncbi:pyridoxal phosphate-dependent aminotransferase [Frigoriglobus tundricola]|uniref:Periplasmic aromatic amino acid aminotransferase beta n=1 Tax=Frigoriglobus tundricola TaxID=2774151 RepID=A0A6M5Z365_9BACT|nr:pyridoxal phosphate-dependent aminotransferase [Frigoriglobus tundricola]QJX00860.1 Periplasmic aromatic amino acid aminotransferase beta precursor [Frigoriglobus tundricola]
MRTAQDRTPRTDPHASDFSRRDLYRRALLAAGAALPLCTEAVLAQDVKSIANIPPDAVRLNANENPLGPCPAALDALRNVAAQGNRYPFRLTETFVRAMAEAGGVPASHVLPAAGSSDPLHRVVLAFTSPSRPLVVASPGYEAPERAARFVGAKVISVPLRKDYSHDTRAMVKADANAGVIYICNPNNPTGTVTAKADIEYVVANKPKGCVVLIDEAYIHYAKTTGSAASLVAASDVIVLRTFSKIYGMAGLRAGAALGRPDLLEKLGGFAGMNFLPATGLAAAVASLEDKKVVPDRCKAVSDVREDLFAWLERKGYGFIPSEANMVMIDGKKPGRELMAALLKEKVAVGRTWAALPTHVRVTIGTPEEMTKFKTAFEKVMDS